MSYLPLEYNSSNIFPKKVISIRPDIHVTVSSGIFESRQERVSKTTAPIVELSYCKNNSISGEVNRQNIELQPGYASLGFLGEVSGYGEYVSEQEVHMCSIWVAPCTFSDFCESVCGKNIPLPSLKNHHCEYHKYKSDAKEEFILHKLDHCIMNSEEHFNKLLVESTILELLSINIERLYGNTNDKQCTLCKTDIAYLEYAREVLLSRLESPPSLMELSHILHMNDCKLKSSFKHYFGKTVYEFIRDERLDKAFTLLEKGVNNVSEAAQAVGYVNVSHFSEAFRKKFGIQPSALKK